ncbi:MAG: nuclear transport factor 2 family protein [Niastella sp.]|nr:nuclear transport factor 2 family protein [Niastella sp.]
MNDNYNEELVAKFYTAFQKLDYRAMNNCYSEEIVFFDPVFELLRGNQVRMMWKMLCISAKDLSIQFDDVIDRGDGYYTCNWIAQYTFSKTGRQVINRVKAHMKIENGKITEHSDGFSLHKWTGQALGLPGKLFGWNRFFQRRIKNNARAKLLAFIDEQS